MLGAENRFSKDDRFRVGDWVFDRAASRLERQGEQIRLEPRLADLLCHFTRNPRRVISKEELIDTVWQGRILDDAAIARAIAELRKALGDTPQAPRYIETIPKRGYRLVAEVNRRGRRWSSAAGIVAAAVTLALVVTLLTSRLATRGKPDTAEPTAAAEGTSSEAALDAYNLAAEALDRGGQVSNESAVIHLKRALEIDPGFALARAGLAEAYSIRAIWYGVDGDWAEAALVEASRAVALAPELPESHRSLGFALATNDRFGEAEVSYRRALELRPEDEEIAFRLGEVLAYRSEWPDALAIFTSLAPGTAVSLPASCEIGALLFGLDYTVEARARLESILATKPYQVCANIRLAYFDLVEGDLESARARTERVSAAHAACGSCDQILGDVAFRQGRAADAASHFARALERTAAYKSTAMRIRLAQLEDDADALRTIAASLERKLTAGADVYFPATLLATIRAGLGDTAGALHWHYEARARGYLDWRWDLAEPSFESLRGTPEFESAISGMRARIREMRSEVESRGLIEKVRLQTARPRPTEP